MLHKSEIFYVNAVFNIISLVRWKVLQQRFSKVIPYNYQANIHIMLIYDSKQLHLAVKIHLVGKIMKKLSYMNKICGKYKARNGK